MPNVQNIVVRASDTDIAVILIHHAAGFKSKLWMELGTSSNNSRRYISITNVAHTLGQLMCAALPAFHALTGTDYTPAMHRRGKVRPLKALEKNKKAQKSLAALAHGATVSGQDKKTLEQFVASLYGARRDDCSLNDHRFQMVLKAYGPKAGSKNPLEKLKGVDGCNIPPAEAELAAQLRRVAFVGRMWHAVDKNMIEQEPEEIDGWIRNGDVYEFIMFDGPQVPNDLLEGRDDVSDEQDEYDEIGHNRR